METKYFLGLLRIQKFGDDNAFTNQISLGAHHLQLVQGPYNLRSNQQSYEMM